jgi:hypothetical protein
MQFLFGISGDFKVADGALQHMQASSATHPDTDISAPSKVSAVASSWPAAFDWGLLYLRVWFSLDYKLRIGSFARKFFPAAL